MAHLAISVLGAFQVLLDGEPVQNFESDKVRALLAYLAVEADRPHSREALIGLLWPDCTEEAARHNLRQALFNLRLALGDHTARPPYLLISRSSIQFNRDSDHSLDLATFNDRFAEWEKNHGRENEVSSALPSPLEEMVDLYRGEFLQHFYIRDSAEFEDWIVVQRETSRQQMMGALTRLADQYELLGDYQAARGFADRQLELDPWREEAHYQVMRILALDGQRSAALAQFESCKRILAAELGVEPSGETRELYEQIRLGTFKGKSKTGTEPAARAVASLPTPLTPFLGREQELVDLAQMLADPQHRCITLVGPGGTGKTRLALRAADRQQHQFAHGCAFIPLSSVGSMNAVILTIASSIQYAFCGPNDPKIQLLGYLQDKSMLLVLDNVEHLLADQDGQGTIAGLVMEILQQAAGIKVLVTSRELMNLQGESSLEVRGLSFPAMQPGDDLEEYSAVALFVQRARRANPGLEMTAEDKVSVARLCNLVEGMPLAIELAASWVRLLHPAEIAAEVERSLDFLDAQMRDLPERHRSMRAVFDHSWKMLSGEEKRVLCRLSVFRGGFQRRAAEEVAGASLPVLASLMMRSLLRRPAAGRYDLHELTRQYAASRLGEDDRELHSAREAHSLYYLQLLEEKDVDLRGHDQKAALIELTAEIDNLRAAWAWCVANREFRVPYRVSFTLAYLYALHNWFAEGEAAFWHAAAAHRASPAFAADEAGFNTMLAHCGYFRFRLGRAEQAYEVLKPSTAFLRSGTQPAVAIYSLWYLGMACLQLGRFKEARECLEESRALSREHGEFWYQALAAEFLGSLARGNGEYDQARSCMTEALSLFRQLGDPMMTSHSLSDLGNILQLLGELDEAEKLLEEGLEIARKLEYCRFGVGLALAGLGQVAYSRANHERANDLLSESASLFREIGDTHRLSQVQNHQGLNWLAFGDLDRAQNAFRVGLKIAHESGLIPAELDALLGLAKVDLGCGALQGVPELVFFVLQHPASAQETKNMAADLRDKLETILSPRDIEAAQERIASKNLDEVVLAYLG